MIKVENLVKSYGSFRALKDVSFEVGKGEIVGFLGPNGAGKTTTMKILTCYLPADSGTVTVAGYDVTKDTLEVRRRIGYLSEGAPLYDDMSTIDFLRFVGQLRGLSSKKLNKQIKNVVEVCGLEKAAGKLIGELSKGYRQRVGLAQALIHEPDILILDEPTSGLDPNQIQEIRNLIKEIGKEKTVILSTHILPEVTATCDRAIIVKDGRIVAAGSPRELMEKSSDEMHVITIIRGPQKDVQTSLSTLNDVKAVNCIEMIEDNVYRYRVTSAEKQPLAEKVFRVVAENDWTLSELMQESVSLEDVFSELTK